MCFIVGAVSETQYNGGSSREKDFKVSELGNSRFSRRVTGVLMFI